MNIFITGASGYIGNAVAQRLKLKGHQIIALSRTGKSTGKLKNLGFSFVEGDMKNPNTWKKEASKADAFIHCAQTRYGKRIGMGWVNRALEADQKCLQGLIDAAKQSGKCKALIYTSGISVVGDYDENWTDETTVPKPSRTVGSYHLHGEQLAHKAFIEGLPIVIIRPSLPISSGGTFADFFLDKASKGKLQYVGNGKNYFPTVHLDDLANAYCLTLENPPLGETIIVSDDDPQTMEGFSNALMQHYGAIKAKSTPKWIVSLFAGKPLANLLVSSYRVKNSKAKKVLGWEPQYPTLKDSLKQIIISKKE